MIRTALNTRLRIPALSNGIGCGVPTNARPNSIFGLGNGNVRELGSINGNSRFIHVVISVPGGVSSRRGGLLVRFSGACGAPGGDNGRNFFSGFGGGWRELQYFLGARTFLHAFTNALDDQRSGAVYLG